MKPLLVTYAHDALSIGEALAAGADHIIIDDPRLSVRSWAPNNNLPFSYLSELANHARTIQPEVILSLNVDKLCHDKHLPLIREGISAAVEAGFDRIRVQDGGLAPILKELAPDLTWEIATETANNCFASVQEYARLGFSYQSLSNEWPCAD